MAPNRCCCPRRRGAKRLLDEDQEGPRTSDERQCTDTCCLLLFVLAMAPFALIGAVALKLGDPRSLQFAEDHLGRRCGIGKLAHLPKTYYPMLGRDLASQADLVNQPWRLRLFGVCVESCPKRGDEAVRDFGRPATSWPVAESTVDVLNRCVPTRETTSSKTVACVLPRCEHVPLVDVQCLPNVPGHETEGFWMMRTPFERSFCQRQITLYSSESYEVPSTGPLIKSVVEVIGTATAAAAEIAKAQLEVLVCGVGLAMLLGIVWLVFLRCFAALTVWFVLWATAATLLLSAIFCAFRAVRRSPLPSS